MASDGQGTEQNTSHAGKHPCDGRRQPQEASSSGTQTQGATTRARVRAFHQGQPESLASPLDPSGAQAKLGKQWSPSQVVAVSGTLGQFPRADIHPAARGHPCPMGSHGHTPLSASHLSATVASPGCAAWTQSFPTGSPEISRQKRVHNQKPPTTGENQQHEKQHQTQ